MDSEWKERGLGDSKLLRHRVSPSNIAYVASFVLLGRWVLVVWHGCSL